jgi:hypothetical protein
VRSIRSEAFFFVGAWRRLDAQVNDRMSWVNGWSIGKYVVASVVVEMIASVVLRLRYS